MLVVNFGVSASASAIPSIRADAKRERCSELLGMTFVAASKGLPVTSPFALVGRHDCGVPPVATAIDCDCELCRLLVLGCPLLPGSRFPGYFSSVTAHREQNTDPRYCSWIRKENYTTPFIISYDLRMCTEYAPFAICGRRCRNIFLGGIRVLIKIPRPRAHTHTPMHAAAAGTPSPLAMQRCLRAHGMLPPRRAS